MTIIAVAAGGAIGALLRFGTAQLAFRLFGAGFPVGTLTVNVVGSLVMGLCAAWFAAHPVPVEWRSFITVGGLGALTTFSTFSLDAVALAERGAPGLAALYVGSSLVLSIGALWLGLSIVRSFHA